MKTESIGSVSIEKLEAEVWKAIDTDPIDLDWFEALLNHSNGPRIHCVVSYFPSLAC